jgi:hypothetical protein
MQQVTSLYDEYISIILGTYDATRRWAMPRWTQRPAVDSCWTTTWLCLDFGGLLCLLL